MIFVGKPRGRDWTDAEKHLALVASQRGFKFVAFHYASDDGRLVAAEFSRHGNESQLTNFVVRALSTTDGWDYRECWHGHARAMATDFIMAHAGKRHKVICLEGTSGASGMTWRIHANGGWQ